MRKRCASYYTDSVDRRNDRREWIRQEGYRMKLFFIMLYSGMFSMVFAVFAKWGYEQLCLWTTTFNERYGIR